MLTSTTAEAVGDWQPQRKRTPVTGGAPYDDPWLAYGEFFGCAACARHARTIPRVSVWVDQVGVQGQNPHSEES
jgi:hypothetical protein